MDTESDTNSDMDSDTDTDTDSCDAALEVDSDISSQASSAVNTAVSVYPGLSEYLKYLAEVSQAAKYQRQFTQIMPGWKAHHKPSRSDLKSALAVPHGIVCSLIYSPFKLFQDVFNRLNSGKDLSGLQVKRYLTKRSRLYNSRQVQRSMNIGHMHLRKAIEGDMLHHWDFYYSEVGGNTVLNQICTAYNKCVEKNLGRLLPER